MTVFCSAALAAVSCAVRSPEAVAAPSQSWTVAVKTFACDSFVDQTKSSAEAGDAAAMSQLAVMYDRGCGVPQDMRKAESLFERAIQKGSTDRLAIGYVALYGDRPDEARGLAVLRQEADAGNGIAASILSRYYGIRETTSDDAATSEVWLERAHASGDLFATAALGFAKASDPAQVDAGHEMLLKAVDAGVPSAIGYESLGYLYGRYGFERDRARGLALYKKAVAAGSASTEFFVAYSNLTAYIRKDAYGSNFPASEVSALKDATQRLLPKNVMDASLGEGMISANDRASYAQAITLMLEGANLARTDFDTNIAFAYSNGLGGPVDLPLAMKYEKMAAQKGDSVAIAFLRSQADAQTHPGYQASDPNGAAQRWHDYEGYNWSQLHPMSGMH